MTIFSPCRHEWIGEEHQADEQEARQFLRTDERQAEDVRNDDLAVGTMTSPPSRQTTTIVRTRSGRRIFSPPILLKNTGAAGTRTVLALQLFGYFTASICSMSVRIREVLPDLGADFSRNAATSSPFASVMTVNAPALDSFTRSASDSVAHLQRFLSLLVEDFVRARPLLFAHLPADFLIDEDGEPARHVTPSSTDAIGTRLNCWRRSWSADFPGRQPARHQRGRSSATSTGVGMAPKPLTIETHSRAGPLGKACRQGPPASLPGSLEEMWRSPR